MSDEAIIRLNFGMRGCGKTAHIRQVIKPLNRLVIFDTLSKDYTDGVLFYDMPELRKFWRKIYQGDFRMIYRPRVDLDEDQIIEDIAEICSLCLKTKNLTLVVEELNIIFDTQRPPKEFNKMIFGGREPGVELISAAQRPIGFGRKITSQAQEFCVFVNTEPDDLKYFKEYLGTEAAQAIRNLEKYQYLKWVYGDGSRKWEILKDEYL